MFSRKVNSSYSSKSSSHRATHSRLSSTSTRPNSCKAKIVKPRRVLESKQLAQDASDRKSFSTGVLRETKPPAKPKKTTKSDFHVTKTTQDGMDYCKRCGDALPTNVGNFSCTIKPKNTVVTELKTKSIKEIHNTAKTKKTQLIAPNNNSHTKTAKSVKSNGVQQYYKNENYGPSNSIEDITVRTKKISLDTIKEVSEIHSSKSLIQIHSDSEEEITFIDTEDQEVLEQLKDFRDKNYFECHSAKSRITNKGSATVLQDHKCVYRFYLNDRLFPVPLSTDHNNQVRCVECHLPMQLNVHDTNKINGTIQAKVTIGKRNQDIMLLLPIKEPLIITEKRKEKPKEKEVMFFGVINLDGFSNKIFSSALPEDSLALKYQKGYQEYVNKAGYSYRDFDKADVIVI